MIYDFELPETSLEWFLALNYRSVK